MTNSADTTLMQLGATIINSTPNTQSKQANKEKANLRIQSFGTAVHQDIDATFPSGRNDAVLVP
jgi:hypothetical protein